MPSYYYKFTGSTPSDPSSPEAGVTYDVGTCSDCGALIAMDYQSQQLHNAWHMRQDPTVQTLMNDMNLFRGKLDYIESRVVALVEELQKVQEKVKGLAKPPERLVARRVKKKEG